MNKLKFITILVAFMAMSLTSQAQKKLKLGFNTGTISSKGLFETEAGDGTKFFIDSSNGNVGIKTNTPTEKLEVVGNLKFSGALMPNNNAGLSGQALISSGSGAAPTWGSATAIFGDIKMGMQVADHNGWIKLDGRLKSTLTATQQAQATAFGFGTNIPNATNAYLVQNGTTLGLISGSNTRAIAQNQLPNVTLSGNTSTDGNHAHTTTLNLRPGYNAANGAIAYLNGDGLAAPVAPATSTTGNHTHTITTSSINGGVVQQPLNIQPLSMSVNTFIYLGN